MLVPLVASELQQHQQLCGLLAGLEVSRLRWRDGRELAAVRLEVDQRRAIKAIEPAHQNGVAFDTDFATDVPSGLGRTGDLKAKVPCVLESLAGLWCTRSRRDWCSQ